MGSAPQASRNRTTSKWSFSTASCRGLRARRRKSSLLLRKINNTASEKSFPKTTPGSILGTAIDVGPMLHQVAHDAQPATCTGLMQGTVASVVLVVNVTDSAFQAVEHHLLDGRKIGSKKVNKTSPVSSMLKTTSVCRSNLQKPTVKIVGSQQWLN